MSAQIAGREDRVWRSAGEFLKATRDDLVRKWIEIARRSLPAAVEMTHFILADSLPQFLEELSVVLEQDRPQMAAVGDIGRSHAAQRSSLKEYDLAQVMDEYDILRQLLFQHFEEAGFELSSRQRDLMLHSIHESKKSAGVLYVRLAKEREQESERELRAAEERFKLAAEATGLASWEYESETGEISHSEALLKLFGIEGRGTQTLRLEDLLERLAPEDRENSKAAIQRSLDVGVPFSHQFRVSAGDGSTRWISGRGQPLGRKLIGVAIDITEQKRTEESIRESAEEFRVLFDLAGTGKVVVDSVTRRYVRVNRRFCEMLGYTEEELIHRTIDELTHPDDVVRLTEFLAEAIRLKRSSWIIEKRYIHKDGHAIWVQVAAALLSPRPGHAPQSIATITDISDRIRAEEQRQELLRIERESSLEVSESLSLLDSLLESAPFGIGFLDPDLRFIRVNPVLARMSGRPVEEHRGKKVEEIFADESGQIGTTLREVLSSRRSVLELELPAGPPGKKRIYLASFYPVITASGELRGVGGIVLDYTERRRVNDAFQFLANASRLLVETLDPEETLRQLAGIVVPALADWCIVDQIDPETKRASRVTVAHFSEERREIVQRLTELNCSADSPEGVGRALREDRQVTRSNESGIDALGTEDTEQRRLIRELGASAYCTTLLKARERTIGALTLVRARPGSRFDEFDLWLAEELSSRTALVTDNARLYFDSTLTNDRLRKERELREQFVSTLTHDLRNPLTAARVSAQMIARHPDRTDRIPGLAIRVSSALERVDRMIQDLLDANRIRAGQPLRLDIGECDIGRVVHEVCEEFASMHGERFKVEGLRSLSTWSSCHDIQRVLENLISNAVKYGDPVAPITTRLETFPDGRFVRLSVHNEGPEISTSDQERLFRPFARTESAQRSMKQGWGLGLTLVKGVAEAHGGSVSVESDPTRGTTFWVDLPTDSRPFQNGAEQ